MLTEVAMRPRSISIALELALALALALAIAVFLVCLAYSLALQVRPIIVLIVLRPVRLGAGLEGLSACQSVRSIRLARTSSSEALKSAHTHTRREGEKERGGMRALANQRQMSPTSTALPLRNERSQNPKNRARSFTWR